MDATNAMSSLSRCNRIFVFGISQVCKRPLEQCLFTYFSHIFKKIALHPIPIVSKNITNKIVNGLKYSLGSACTIRIAHMGVKEIFGSCRWKANLALRSKGDFHRHNHVNFSHPHVNHTIAKLGVEIKHGVDQIQGDVEVLEAPCGDGVWHIERCPYMLHVYCFASKKSTNHSCVIRIISKPTSISVPAPTYSSYGLSSLVHL